MKRNNCSRWFRSIARESVKAALSPMLSWNNMDAPKPGYSIILGVPWSLRHLLDVNLRFVAKTDLNRLHKLHIVFDKVKPPDAEQFMESTSKSFPALPMDFTFHPALPNRILRFVNKGAFYAGMNWILGLKKCETRYAILHDFDLYPLVPEYFFRMFSTLEGEQSHFCGCECTDFSGLTCEDNIFGTWALGMDAQWLRENYRPVECFHVSGCFRDRYLLFDTFLHIQSQTSRRKLIPGGNLDTFIHVQNLAETHMHFVSHRNIIPTWRLHVLWYLEYILNYRSLESVTAAMQSEQTALLKVDGRRIDFSRNNLSAADFLSAALQKMECALFGECRQNVIEYAEEFRKFMIRTAEHRHATTRVTAAAGTV